MDHRAAPRIVDPIVLTLERADVTRFLDYPAGRLPPARIEALLEEALAEGHSKIRAKGTYRTVDVSDARAVGLEPVAADALVLGLVTAGPAIEARVSELLAAGELTRALLLDAVGSAAAEAAADAMGEMLGVGDEAQRSDPLPREPPPGPLRDDPRATRISCRLSPGYGRWTLRWQRELFAHLPHRELGIELAESCLMVPRKSISFAMWLGARERIGSGLAGCSECSLGQCRYRRRAPRPAVPDPDQGASP